jgi:hypothetical protein
MKTLWRVLLAALVAITAANAHAQRAFEPAELEALLAPIALYPDSLLAGILDASRYPQDVAAAASWSRANPQLSGDAALATVQGTTWPPSVKALTAYPEVLGRMDESPQWLRDLGDAYASYGPNLMATVQELRSRAQAAGNLQSNDQQYVYQQGSAIVVQPAYPNLVYARYYDPYIVYGGWYWNAYRPVYWRPWAAHPYFVTRVVIAPPMHHRYPPARYPAPRVVHGSGQPFVHRAPPAGSHGGNPFARR